MKPFYLITYLYFLISMFFLTQTQAQVDLNEGLVAYYPFNNNAMDESDYANDASVIEAATIGEGIDGTPESAYFFEGIDNYIIIPDSEQINFDANEAFAISVWVFVPFVQEDDDGTVNDIIVKWSNNFDITYPFGLRIFNQNHEDPGKIWFGRYDTNVGTCYGITELISTKTINTNTWHHIVMQYTEDGEMQFFINGLLDSTIMDNSTCSVGNDNPLILGARTTTDPYRVFSGGLDELRIYNRSVNLDEVIALFNNDIPPEEPSFSTNLSKSELAFKVYPNPVQQGILRITNLELLEVEKIGLINIAGEKIQDLPLQSQIELPTIMEGIYFVEVKTKTGIFREKIAVVQ